MEEVHSARVPETMNGIEVLESFWWKCFCKIFFADPIDAVTGYFLPALIDKDPMLIWGLRIYAVFTDIELEELGGFGFDFYKPVPISLAQDGQGALLWIEVIEIQGRDFTGPGPRVKKKMKESVIPEALCSPDIDGLKDLQDFFLV